MIFPLFAIGDRLITIVEIHPDCFRYYDELAGEISGGAFDGTKLPLALSHLAGLECGDTSKTLAPPPTNQQTAKG